MVVGGHTDNDVDLCEEDNTDSKRQYLGKGQTILTKELSQSEFEECWSETIIKNGLSPSSSLSEDPRHNHSYGSINRVHGQGNYTWKEDIVTSS